MRDIVLIIKYTVWSETEKKQNLICFWSQYKLVSLSAWENSFLGTYRSPWHASKPDPEFNIFT